MGKDEEKERASEKLQSRLSWGRSGVCVEERKDGVSGDN